MWRFIGKRILQGIPTVAGVVLVTFVLFNVVGGSPAAMVLGQNAGARAMEEFDESRGFNKPLFFGRWAKSRMLADVDFRTASPGIRAEWGAGESVGGPLRLAAGETVVVPLAFVSTVDARWRLEVVAAGEGALRVSNGAGEEAVEEFSIPWKTGKKVFHSVEKLSLTAVGGDVAVRGVRLRRELRGWWDSQFVFYVGRLARLDFGVSSSLNQPVWRLLAAGIGPSLALTVPIFVVELVVSLCLALVCAWRRGTWWDRSLTLLCIGLMSINYLVWIILGQYWLAYRWGWFPVWGFESWRNLCLPVLVGVATGLGVNVRFYRTVLLEEMNKEYVRMARAKGLSDGRILFKHVLKNAMAPVITNTAMALPFLYTGSLMLEGYFGIPGLGYLSLNAIHSLDVDVVRAVVLVGAVLCVAANILADVAYAWVDPRVKLG